MKQLFGNFLIVILSLASGIGCTSAAGKMVPHVVPNAMYMQASAFCAQQHSGDDLDARQICLYGITADLERIKYTVGAIARAEEARERYNYYPGMQSNGVLVRPDGTSVATYGFGGDNYRPINNTPLYLNRNYPGYVFVPAGNSGR